eukprot:407384-Hanusia_phi.AAC.3
MYDQETADAIRIQVNCSCLCNLLTSAQYGGSVTPDSVDELMSKPDIDGAWHSSQSGGVLTGVLFRLFGWWSLTRPSQVQPHHELQVDDCRTQNHPVDARSRRYQATSHIALGCELQEE